MQDSLPRAPPPGQQTVSDTAIWHTTLGRLLAVPHPHWSAPGRGGTTAVQRAAQEMSETLCGLQARVDRIWFVREYDILALALGGQWAKDDVLLSAKNC
jgi:hypothetical protein